LFLLSTKGGQSYWDRDFTEEEVWLVFGPETRGLPDGMLAENAERVLRIPMVGTRSLNLATAAAIVLYEAVRQRHAVGMGF
jgi:tRNA (cytidine/uridine-2'-O-)-methyltransferase